MSETKKEKIQAELIDLLGKHDILDVGKGAEKYFGCSQTTLNRAVKDLADAGKARIFYIQTQKKDTEEWKINAKVLAPLDWAFPQVMMAAHNVISLSTKENN